MGLVLGRSVGQTVWIGNEVEVQVLLIEEEKVRIGVWRGENFRRIDLEVDGADVEIIPSVVRVQAVRSKQDARLHITAPPNWFITRGELVREDE